MRRRTRSILELAERVARFNLKQMPAITDTLKGKIWAAAVHRIQRYHKPGMFFILLHHCHVEAIQRS